VKVVVTGASGLIGTALVTELRADGHQVVRLVRHPAVVADEAHWDPAHRLLDVSVLAGADAVVHLAGAGVGDKRWSASHKKAILDSRVDGTTTIAEALASIADPKDRPGVLISASAVGYYGERGDAVLDESASSGSGFLADVVRQWEGATAAAEAVGIRVVHIRTGLVLSPDGGVLGKTLPLFKVGLGGRLGSGQQWMPWIALADEVAAIRFLISADDVSGPVNLAAPNPVRNVDYTAAVGRAVHRPTLAPVPAFALRAALAGFADEGALVSQRAVPRRLQDAGFEFQYDDLDEALRSLLSR
jgi:uncharacterized protein (TIGR01777 family)